MHIGRLRWLRWVRFSVLALRPNPKHWNFSSSIHLESSVLQILNLFQSSICKQIMNFICKNIQSVSYNDYYCGQIFEFTCIPLGSRVLTLENFKHEALHATTCNILFKCLSPSPNICQINIKYFGNMASDFLISRALTFSPTKGQQTYFGLPLVKKYTQVPSPRV